MPTCFLFFNLDRRSRAYGNLGMANAQKTAIITSASQGIGKLVESILEVWLIESPRRVCSYSQREAGAKVMTVERFAPDPDTESRHWVRHDQAFAIVY
jgi:hypothetical protein